jgi:hypothetical protein
MSHLDFSMSVSVFWAFFSCFLFPLFLYASQFIRSIHDKHALRFVICTAISIVLWLLLAMVFNSKAKPIEFIDLVLGLAVICCSTILYLQVWGLLTRGYTLAILRTLLESNKPLNATEIGAAYRNFEGLDWIMKHRMQGLHASGMIIINGDNVRLTLQKGKLIACTYAISKRLLGLGRTG